MMHGDYHIKNIMMQNGEVLLIDMDTLCVGHPIFELASMYLGFVGFGECDPKKVENFLGIPYDTAVDFWKKSLKLYLESEDDNYVKSVEEKCMIIAYTRLMRRTIRRGGFDSSDGLQIINLCKKRLAELLPKIDSLDF
jgi:thiamine kinase-like enzyme